MLNNGKKNIYISVYNFVIQKFKLLHQHNFIYNKYTQNSFYIVQKGELIIIFFILKRRKKKEICIIMSQWLDPEQTSI